MNKKLQEALIKFYKAHQITKNKNILDMHLNKDYSFNTGDFAPKCVCSVFEITDKPWSESAVKSKKGQEQCFYTRQDLKVYFGAHFDFFMNQEIANKGINENINLSCVCPCDACFKFCIERYFNMRGGIKLKTKKKKSLLSKIL